MLGDRHKGYVRDFAEYDSDLETFMRDIVLPDCPPPLFAIGHSTGATVLVRAAHRGHRWFDRMVLTSPLITLGGVDYSMGAGAIIVRVMRMAGFGSIYVPKSDTSIVESRPFVGNILTSDPVRYARNAAILEAILSGKETGPKRDMVLLNSGAALACAGLADHIGDGI